MFYLLQLTSASGPELPLVRNASNDRSQPFQDIRAGRSMTKGIHWEGGQRTLAAGAKYGTSVSIADIRNV